MKEYELVKKAYRVGSKEDFKSLHNPELAPELVFVNKNEGPNEARSNVSYCDIPYIERRAIREKENDMFLFEGRVIGMQAIEDIKKTRKWKRETEDFVKNNIGKKVYIYSTEHGLYWGHNGAGYTSERKYAGIYDIETAWEYTSHCSHHKGIIFKILD